jgi:hypothetical protein
MTDQVLAGKTGVVFGVANKRCIAWAIAKAWASAGRSQSLRRDSVPYYLRDDFWVMPNACHRSSPLKYFSASIAAAHPEPAAVIACL